MGSGTPSPRALDADGRVTLDLPCGTCRYSLRGRRPDDACPECGARVGASVRDDLAMYAPAGVRRRWRWGTRLLLVAIGGELLLLVVFNLLVLVDRLVGTTGGLNFTFFWATASLILATAGAWLVTSDDRGVPVPRSARVARWLARLLPCAELAVRYGAWPLYRFFRPTEDWVEPLWLGLSVWDAQSLLLDVVSAGAIVALFVALRWFAPRVPDARLVRRAATIIVVYVATEGLGLAQSVWYRVTDPDPATFGEPRVLLIGTGFVAFMLLVAYLCLAVQYLLRLHAGLRAADRLAAVIPEAASSPGPSGA